MENGNQDNDMYLSSLSVTIQEEMTKEFGAKGHLYHIYNRLQKDQNKLEIFVRLNRNSEVNPTKSHIYFIITIGNDYPNNEPYVVFASELLLFPSLNDQRNLLNCLHPEWRSTSKLSTIIYNMHTFIQGYENDIKNNLLVPYGSYIWQTYHYCLNDFLSNSNNIILKVKAIIDLEKNIFEDYYLFLTDICLLLFAIYPIDKSKGQIIFVSEIRMIEGIFRIDLDPDNKALQDKIGFQLLWKETSNSCDYGFVANQLEFKKFQDKMMERNTKIANNFFFFYESDRQTFETLFKIITIKESFLDQVYDWYTFNSLLELYQNLIEMSSNEKADNLGLYVQKLQSLVKKHKKSSDQSSIDK